MTDSRLSKERIVPARKLDSKGRCCGRKPIVYKRDPHRFCTKCSRAYASDAPDQVENWAFKSVGAKEFAFVFDHMAEQERDAQIKAVRARLNR